MESVIQQIAPAEQRASIENEINRRQIDRDELMQPKEGETPDKAIRRQQDADAMLKKINKLKSELLKL